MGRPRVKPRPTDIKAPLGDRIRFLRERSGLTQGQLAIASGVSKVFLGTVERGEKAATVETLEKIARGLQAEPHELFEFSAKEASVTPADALGRRIAALARGASTSKLSKIERLVRLFLEPERDGEDRRLGPKRRSPGRSSRRGTSR
ncbi:MAG: helix-turn-helix transcriptional regulator [Planctomycetota bacterium]|nr:helix-turn-helix transcriptional regulator [Planctomycetota bacterium]